MNTSLTLIIGLDGATFDLIKPLIRAGHLPALAKLMAQGVHGPLQTWPNMNSAAAWSSMVTGYNPGQHGVFNFGFVPPQHDYQWRPNTAIDRKKDPFWRLLSEAGQQVGIINVPITYPADPVNGFMLAGMDTPSVNSFGFAHPPTLRDELRRQGIDYVIDVPNLEELNSRNPYKLPQPVQRMMDARSQTILHLMRTHRWETLMAVFVATDRIQHHFWPDQHTSVENSDWTPVRRIYEQIDSFLSAALTLIDENTTVLVVSDHGFGQMRLGKICLNQLFAKLGLLHYGRGTSRLKNQLLKYLLLYGRKVIPFSLQNPLARSLPGLHVRALCEHRFPGIEWSQNQVFATPDGQQVFIKLQGREPAHKVSFEEYYTLRERVRDILLNLIDPVSGRRVIQLVHSREDIYSGPFLEKAPDLVMRWNFEAVRDALCYPIGKEPIIVQPLRSSGPSTGWNGDHRPEGIFIAYGPHIKQGKTVDNATLYDIAPTILYLQGHPIPRDMDGKVLTDIFTEEQLCHYPVKYAEPTSVRIQTIGTPLDAEEARKIEERLRSLGYIE